MKELELKIIQGEKLDEEELNSLELNFKVVYEEIKNSGRWVEYVTTVFELSNGDLYALDWERGLTEMQESEFFEQPYKVRLEEEVVQVVNIIIHRV